MEEQILEAFRQFDVDGDGTLTFKELHHVMDRIAPDVFSVLDIVTIFDQMDIDEDETIQYEEFVHWCCHEGGGPVVEAVLDLATRPGEAATDSRSRRRRSPRAGRGRRRRGGGQESFPVSDERVSLQPAEPPVHVEITPFHREGLGFEGGHRVEHDGGFLDMRYATGAISRAKDGHDGDVVEVGSFLGVGVSVSQGVNIGTDRDQKAQVSYGFGEGAGFGISHKSGIDHTGATIVQTSAMGFGAGFSCGGDHTFGISVKAFGFDLGFKLTLQGLEPTNATVRQDLQSTFKWKMFRNTMTAAKNYARGQIKHDKKHRFCTITEHFAGLGSHFTVYVYDCPDDSPASFKMIGGHHEILYDKDEFISKDFAEGEFLKFNRKAVSIRRGKPPQLMNQTGYTRGLSDFIIEPCYDGMIMLRFDHLYVGILDDSAVTVCEGGTPFKVRPVEDRSGRFVLEAEGLPGHFIGRSDDKVVKLTTDVSQAQMRAIEVGVHEAKKLFAFRFGG